LLCVPLSVGKSFQEVFRRPGTNCGVAGQTRARPRSSACGPRLLITSRSGRPIRSFRESQEALGALSSSRYWRRRYEDFGGRVRSDWQRSGTVAALNAQPAQIYAGAPRRNPGALPCFRYFSISSSGSDALTRPGSAVWIGLQRIETGSRARSAAIADDSTVIRRRLGRTNPVWPRRASSTRNVGPGQSREPNFVFTSAPPSSFVLTL